MRVRRSARAIGGVIAVLIAQTLVFGGVAAADTVGPQAQGWWSEAQQSPQALPINTVTGPNLQVGGDPTGPNAIAAVRYAVPGTVDGLAVDPASVPAALTLKVAPNTAVGTPAVVACPVLGTWQPATAGTWSTQPAYNCARSAPGALSADKATMVFKLDPALQAHSGVYDLALVPPAGNQAPFSVQFLPPGTDSLALGSGSSAAAAGSDAGAAVSTDAPLPLSSDSSSVSAPLGASPSFDAGSSLPIGSTPAVPAPARVATPSPSRLLPAPLRRAVSTKRSQQAIALALLGAIVLALWWFGGEQARAPRLLGSLGDSVAIDDPNLFVRTGGIGRFARPRTKPPVRL